MKSLKKFTHKLTVVTVAVVLSVTTFIGCSSKPNDLSQDPTPGPQYKTPVSLKVNSIEVVKFSNKSWDPTEIITAWKKADLWVSLGRNGADPDYSSNTVENASATSSHTFTKSGVLFGKELPLSYSYFDHLVITAWDQDVLSRDKIASVSLSPEEIYTKDDATTFRATLNGSNSCQIVVRGQWLY